MKWGMAVPPLWLMPQTMGRASAGRDIVRGTAADCRPLEGSQLRGSRHQEESMEACNLWGGVVIYFMLQAL